MKDMFGMIQKKNQDNSEDPSSMSAGSDGARDNIANDAETAAVQPYSVRNGITHNKKDISNNGSFLSSFTNFFKKKSDTSLRDAIEEYISESVEDDHIDQISSQERAFLHNILSLRQDTVLDVMIPRADITAVEVNSSQQELLQLYVDKRYSRMPVYRDTLDDVLGTIHLKDVLECLARGEEINIENLITEVPVISPAMCVLNLILEMRTSKRHVALVVDEFGGIDGLVTIGDIIEAIIGKIDDEHDLDQYPLMSKHKDGSLHVDARLALDDFEDKYGRIFSEEEHVENDTIGGLVCYIAGHVPARGEVLTHKVSGMRFEVLDADPRRVNLIRIQNIPVALGGE